MPERRETGACRALAAFSGLLLLGACTGPYGGYTPNAGNSPTGRYGGLRPGDVEALALPNKSDAQFNYEFNNCQAIADNGYNVGNQGIVFAKCMLRLGYLIRLPNGQIIEPLGGGYNQFASGYPPQQPFYQSGPPPLPQAQYQDPQPSQEAAVDDPFKSTPQRSRIPDNTSSEQTPLITSGQQGKLVRDAGAAAYSAYRTCKMLMLEPPLMSECMAAKWAQRMVVSVGKNVLIPAVCRDPGMIDRFFEGVVPVTSGMRDVVLSTIGCESKA